MKITEHTKISEIIEYDKDAIDIIASVNKNFKKLKNPFLRKLLAHRVSIKDAAKIGGVKVNDILQELKNAGFDVNFSKEENKDNDEILNNKIKMNKENTVKLDVRPILETGTDPYHAIMETLKTMSDNETLLLINSFEPVPLLNKLKSQGYEYEVERPEDKVVYTYLSKTGSFEPEKPDSDENDTLSFEEAEKKYAGKMKEIDVRDLEMPMPMVSILEEIEKLNDGEALYVHHKRLPQYLLPELETRGWVYANKEVDENNMKFIIYKK